LAHSISYPLTAHFGVDHGLACAYSLGPISRYVLDKSPDILAQVARLAGFEDAASLVDSLEDLLRRLSVTELLQADFHNKDLVNLREEMITPGRSDNFILPVTEDLLDIIIGRA
jgi:alcohol dehydrogenase